MYNDEKVAEKRDASISQSCCGYKESSLLEQIDRQIGEVTERLYNLQKQRKCF